MKFLGLRATALLLAGTLAISPCFAQMKSAKKECTCHSKQPAMKRMHETIGFNGCGNCHSKNENLMSGKNQVDANRKAVLAKRIREDQACIPCHDSQGKLKKADHSGTDIPSIMDTLYCPKDKLRFSAGTRLCSKCGGSLLNISELTERSRRNPSNELCMECHRMEEVQQIKRHTIFNATKLKQCLDCHQGHDDCDSCHH
jgi:hypothetical protein